MPGELRGYLTVVPETRWLKHADHRRFFYEETTEHYEDHRADLEAVLEAARGVSLRELLDGGGRRRRPMSWPTTAPDGTTSGRGPVSRSQP